MQEVDWPAVRIAIGQLFGQAAGMREIDGALMDDIFTLNSRIRCWRVEDVEEARLRTRLVLRRRQEAPALAPYIGEVCRLLGMLGVECGVARLSTAAREKIREALAGEPTDWYSCLSDLLDERGDT